MLIWGISALHHDAAIAVVREVSPEKPQILFAAQAERYSRVKNDPHLNAALVSDAMEYGFPDQIVWYETSWKSRMRMLMSGDMTGFKRPRVKNYLREFGLDAPLTSVGHHEAHAAGGFYTSGFERAAILVLDAVGEFDTESLWVGDAKEGLSCLWRQKYPDGIGMFYTAFTDRLGLKPNEEEYILMGMAAAGEPIYAPDIKRDLIADWYAKGEGAPTFHLRQNVHRGVRWWREGKLTPDDHPDVAASVQHIAEEHLVALAKWARCFSGETDLVLMGGVALNCVANSRIARESGFERVWIMPHPGDGGSALGAAAAHLKTPLDWRGPFLGYDAGGAPSIAGVVTALASGEPVGICHGRAEFGPRALGHRSLLMDPRLPKAQERMNAIKGREPFRPFAPSVLAERAADFFDMPLAARTPYMQFVAGVKEREYIPAVTHFDGTARVQTVGYDDCHVLREILEAFHAMTGCPVLLHTSLNVKGEPLVNTWADAQAFSRKTGVQVF